MTLTKRKPSQITFAVSEYDYKAINERVAASGMTKVRYLTNCCKYSHYCVVGSKEHIDRLIRRIKVMEDNLRLILEEVQNGAPESAEEGIETVKEDYYLMVKAIVELVEQANIDIKK